MHTTCIGPVWFCLSLVNRGWYWRVYRTHHGCPCLAIGMGPVAIGLGVLTLRD